MHPTDDEVRARSLRHDRLVRKVFRWLGAAMQATRGQAWRRCGATGRDASCAGGATAAFATARGG
eukprot:275890-Pyramimonas_sp.AAC.1